MAISNSTPAVLFHDPQALQGLKREANADPAKALLPVAKQFESVYLQMMLKSMRAAVPESGLFSDEAGKTYRDMFDNQLSVNLAEQGGIGLAKVREATHARAAKRTNTGVAVVPASSRREYADHDRARRTVKRQETVRWL